MHWPSLLRAARRMVNLTQEDFAADLGRSQSLMALWESGKRPLPPAVRRRVLDILAGYYQRRPEYAGLVARVATLSHPATLYRPGMIVDAGNSALLESMRRKGVDFVGASILPHYRAELRVLEMTETHLMRMLEGRSEVVSISFNDRSLLFPERLVRRTGTVVRMGEGRMLLIEDQFIGVDPGAGMPEADLVVVTTDDAGDDASGETGGEIGGETGG